MESETARGAAKDDGREREDHLRGSLQRPQEATPGKYGPRDRLHQERHQEHRQIQ